MILFKRNKVKEKEQWHIWFAWHPVTIDKTNDGDFKKIWLENVLRCGKLCYCTAGSIWSWKYKEIIK
jgi:hypothetical protein